jgi:hypothetical protein
MSKFIVYALLDPTTKTPVYVGATCRGITRPLEWFKQPSRAKGAFRAWLKVNALTPSFEVLEFCAPEVLYKREVYWIERLRVEGATLFNSLKGRGSVKGLKFNASKDIRLKRRRLNKAKRQRGPIKYNK